MKAQLDFSDLPAEEQLNHMGVELADCLVLTEGYLTYEDNSFDVVTCIQSFYHYPKPEKQYQGHIVFLNREDYILFLIRNGKLSKIHLQYL